MKKSQKPIPHHVHDFLDWLDIEKGLSTKSQENYARFLKKFLDWLHANELTELKPHELSSDQIWHYRIFLSRQQPLKDKQPLKKSTQNYYLIALRSLLNYFADRDIVSLPAEKIKLARDKSERSVRFLTLDQLEKLFSAPDTVTNAGLRDYAILRVLFSTGMRVAELVALNRNQIRIKSGIKELEIGIVGKGGRSRTIYLSEGALTALEKYLRTREDDDPALFVNYRSKGGSSRRLTSRSIEKQVKKYAIQSGIPLTTTPHVMRHSFATDLLAQGVDLRTIQEFLGHKSIAATQIYAHVTNKQLRDIHQKFHSDKKFKITI